MDASPVNSSRSSLFYVTFSDFMTSVDLSVPHEQEHVLLTSAVHLKSHTRLLVIILGVGPLCNLGNSADLPFRPPTTQISVRGKKSIILIQFSKIYIIVFIWSMRLIAVSTVLEACVIIQMG